MTTQDLAASAIGGVLVGIAATMLMLLNGRIAGISGMVGDVLNRRASDKGWRVAFIVGLLAAPLLAGLAGYALPVPAVTDNWALMIGGGLLVGIGARLGSGCTAGHGMCGVARVSARSLAATAVFMTAAIVVVAIMRHGIGS